MNINSKHILLEDRKSVNGLEVSHNLGIMNWHEAKIACKNLGKGWRLPTKDELNMLYKNKKEIGSFVNGIYWSSTEDDNGYLWKQLFTTGLQYTNDRIITYYTRAVRYS